KCDNHRPGNRQDKTTDCAFYGLLRTDLRVEQMLAESLPEVIGKYIGRPDYEQTCPDIGQSRLLQRVAYRLGTRRHQITKQDKVAGHPTYVDESQYRRCDISYGGRWSLGAEQQPEERYADTYGEKQRELPEREVPRHDNTGNVRQRRYHEKGHDHPANDTR